MYTEAVTKSSLPIVLVATKCDIPSAERKVEPSVVEQNAKRINKNIATLQVSELNPDGYKRGISMLMNAIVNTTPGMVGYGTEVCEYAAADVIHRTAFWFQESDIPSSQSTEQHHWTFIPALICCRTLTSEF